jgi:hypothetical protein
MAASDAETKRDQRLVVQEAESEALEGPLALWVLTSLEYAIELEN